MRLLWLTSLPWGSCAKCRGGTAAHMHTTSVCTFFYCMSCRVVYREACCAEERTRSLPRTTFPIYICTTLLSRSLLVGSPISCLPPFILPITRLLSLLLCVIVEDVVVRAVSFAVCRLTFFSHPPPSCFLYPAAFPNPTSGLFKRARAQQQSTISSNPLLLLL